MEKFGNTPAESNLAWFVIRVSPTLETDPDALKLFISYRCFPPLFVPGDGRKCKFSQVCASWLRSVEETREGIFVAKISLENKNIGRRSSVEIRSSFWGKDCFSRIWDRAREIVTGNKNLIQREESWSKSMRFEVISKFHSRILFYFIFLFSFLSPIILSAYSSPSPLSRSCKYKRKKEEERGRSLRRCSLVTVGKRVTRNLKGNFIRVIWIFAQPSWRWNVKNS